MSRTVLIECSPRRPSDGVVVPVRLCWKARAAANFLGQQWEPCIEALPDFQSSLGFDGRNFAASPLPQVGELRFALSDRTRASLGLIWKNAAFTIRMADWPASGGNPADGAFTIISAGQIDSVAASGGTARVTMLDGGQALRVAAAQAKFGSSGDALLDSADAVSDRSADTVVPLAFGRVFSVPGLLVDRANNIWLFSGRPATSVQGFYDGGAAFTTGVARASLAALQGAVPAAGAVDYVLDAAGKFLARPWTPPTFPFTSDATFGSALAADIAVAVVAGRTSFAAGTVAAFNSLQAAPCGIYIDDSRTVAEVLDDIFGGLGTAWRVRAAGGIHLRRVGFATPALTVPAHRRGAPERNRIIVPTGRRSLGYARNNKVHSEGDIAAIVTATDVVYVDGTLVEALKPATPGATRNIPRGVHNSTLTYSQYDTVTTAANDKLYSAKIDVPAGIALTNTVYWQLEIVSGGGAAGANAVQVRLDNPVIFVATAADGSGGSYSGLTCQVEVYDGPTRRDTVPGLVTYAIIGTPAFASISSAGLATITNWGSTAVDVKIDTTYAGVTYRTTLALRRSLGGVAGPALVMSGGGAFEFVDGAATPGQTRTFTIIRQNAVGTATWTTVPADIALTGTGDSRTLAVADMTGHRQVTVRATVGSVYDEDTAIRVDRSTAEAGANLSAPSNGNLVPFSRFERGMDDWPILTNVGAVPTTPFAAEVEGRRVGTYSFQWNASVNVGAFRSEFFPVQGGTRVSAQVRAGIENIASVASWFIGLHYYDQSGTYMSSGFIASGTTVLPAWRDPPFQAFLDVPVGARTAFIWLQASRGGSAGSPLFVMSEPHVSPALPGQTAHPTFTPGRNAQDGADITATAVAQMTLPAVPTVRHDFTGAALAGELPRNLQARRFRGGVDVTTTSSWSISAVGCTATVGAATGIINITSVAATGRIIVASVRDSFTITEEFAVVKDVAAPPATGGGGGTVGGSASTTTIGSVSSSTYGGLQAGPLIVKAGAAGTINLSAPLSFGSEVNTATRGKWQILPPGGSWTDVHAEIGSTETAIAFEPGTGYIEVNASATGLTSGLDYEFRLLLRRSAGTQQTNFSGTASAVAA